MTKEQEVKQQNTQVEQDEITLDYEKWQAQQIKANLPSHHLLWTQKRDAVLQRQRIERDKVRRNRLNNMEVERRAQRRDNNPEVNLKIAAELNHLRSQWLRDNPDKTEADFEKVRYLFRELLLEQHYTDTLNEQVSALNKKP